MDYGYCIQYVHPGWPGLRTMYVQYMLAVIHMGGCGWVWVGVGGYVHTEIPNLY